MARFAGAFRQIQMVMNLDNTDGELPQRLRLTESLRLLMPRKSTPASPPVAS